MKNKIYLISVTLGTFLFIVLFILYDVTSEYRLHLIDGEADFTNLSVNDNYTIDGEWEVYLNKLIETDNIDLSTQEPSYLQKVPNNDYRFKTFGYLSYRAVLHNFPIGEDIVVMLDGEYDGFAIYINNVLTFTNNKLEKDHNIIVLDDYNLQYTNNNNDLEIVIELSNYHLGYTGLTKYPALKSYSSFETNLFLNTGFKLFLIGALFFSAIYQLIVFAIRSKEKQAILFALICLTYASNILFYNSPYSYYIHTLFNFNNQIGSYIHYNSYLIGTLLIFLLIRSFYNKKRLELTDVFISISTFVLISLSLLMPYRNYTLNLHVFLGINIVVLLIVVFYSILNIKEGPYNIFITYMVIMTLLGFIYDLLVHENIIYDGEEISVGIAIVNIFIYSSITAFNREQEMSKVEEIIKLNEKIRDTEFTFLNSQIQSHFIYNTLNSIQSLCNTNPAKAGELIDDFSTYLRTRLEFNKMPILINIEDELENIRTYLNIEKERFGKRVNYTYDLKIGDFLIPPLTIQPLVENAIKHGISKKKGGGTVNISTYQDDNYIYVKVEDDGLGFDPKSLNEKQRVGTDNIRNRLNLHLKATLTITSEVNIGTKSVIKIPKALAKIH